MSLLKTKDLFTFVVMTALLIPTVGQAQQQGRECGLRQSVASCVEVRGSSSNTQRARTRDTGFVRRNNIADQLPVRPTERLRDGAVGQRVRPSAAQVVTDPNAYGLAALRPGLAYARIGPDIYIVERDTGLVLALALIREALR